MSDRCGEYPHGRTLIEAGRSRKTARGTQQMPNQAAERATSHIHEKCSKETCSRQLPPMPIYSGLGRHQEVRRPGRPSNGWSTLESAWKLCKAGVGVMPKGRTSIQKELLNGTELLVGFQDC
ncbi:hypothetical protein ABVT39_018107 [Epinephelus coioides]